MKRYREGHEPWPNPPLCRQGGTFVRAGLTPGQDNDAVNRLRGSKELLLFVSSTMLLAAGGAAWLLAAETPSDILWVADTLLGLAFSLFWTIGAIRRRQASVDVIAVLALAGALAVDEPFAGAMITVMLASGQLLEGAGGRKGTPRAQSAGRAGTPHSQAARRRRDRRGPRGRRRRR